MVAVESRGRLYSSDPAVVMTLSFLTYIHLSQSYSNAAGSSHIRLIQTGVQGENGGGDLSGNAFL